MLSKQSYNEYLGNVGQKLEKVVGKMIIPNQRDEEAVRVHTVGRLLQASKNFYFSRGGEKFDPMESFYAGFSAGSGFGDVEGLASRGTEDISILSAVLSLTPFLAIERSLDSPEQNISFQYLSAMNSIGGINEGDVVQTPFAPPPLDVDVALQGVTIPLEDEGTVSFGAPLVKGSVYVKNGKAEGRDYDKNGRVAWTGEGKDALTVDVNYDAGTVTIAGSVADGTVFATIDSTKSTSGEGILRLKPDYDTTLLVTTPRNLILESSLAAEAYRNKMLQNSIDAGMTLDLGEQAFRQVLQAYLAYINRLLVAGIINCGEVARANQGGKFVEEDITGYTVSGSFAPTKDDIVQRFFLNLNAALLKSSGFGATCIITGVEGANILANVAGKFVSTPDFFSSVDGYVGTYNNIPVIRHRLVDKHQEAKWANVYIIYKSADGKAGPLAMGEYLPVYATRPVMNFANPSQYAQALFSYLGVKDIVSTLCAVGRIKYIA